MKRNLWLVIGYHDNAALGYPYDHKTRGLGIPLGVYSTEELAREVGEAYARDEKAPSSGRARSRFTASSSTWARAFAGSVIGCFSRRYAQLAIPPPHAGR